MFLLILLFAALIGLAGRIAQRGFTANDLNKLSAADQLHAATVRSRKSCCCVGIDQAGQRAELYALDRIEKNADGIGNN